MYYVYKALPLCKVPANTIVIIY